MKKIGEFLDKMTVPLFWINATCVVINMVSDLYLSAVFNAAVAIMLYFQIPKEKKE